MARQSKPSCLVLIASSDSEVRSRWMRGLREMSEIHSVGDRVGLHRAVFKMKPSVLLLDLNLRDLEGVKGMIAIQRLSPMTKIIVLTSSVDDSERLRALEAGARGYCDPDIDSVLMKRAVQIVQKGEIWAQRSAMLHLIKELSARNQYWEMASRSKPPRKSPRTNDSTLNELTAREIEIAKLVSQAASNKQIAGLLNIAEATVKGHLTMIFRKLGVADRVALALLMSGLF
jgi:two-component system nitrate/nitrite response regulator NarL